MKRRSEQLEPVAEVTEEAERRCAARLADAAARLAEAEQRCAQLCGYLQEYQQKFCARAAGGIGASGMRDYQLFIARLTEAVQQQQQLIEQLRAESEQERASWREAAVRRRAIGRLIDDARSEDRRREERRAQRELDEHAQRLGGSR